MTVPLPVYNRNQGNIRRAELNIPQTQIQLQRLEQRVAIEIRDAEREYANTRSYLEELESGMLASAREALEGTRKLFSTGELPTSPSSCHPAQYNDHVRRYRDTAIRHSRSVVGLNPAVGTRILP